jgi:hypothetical protein
VSEIFSLLLYWRHFEELRGVTGVRGAVKNYRKLRKMKISDGLYITIRGEMSQTKKVE